MSIARINSLEFETEADLEERQAMFDNGQLAVPNIVECVISIKTSETSMLSILVYPDTETANNGLEHRKEFMLAGKIKDQWYMEGEVKNLKLNKRIY